MPDYTDYSGFSSPACDKDVLFSATGSMRTASLFIETNHKGLVQQAPMYTMRALDHKGMVSAYQVYMNSVDEYEAALKLVGSMRHWRALLKCTWFMNAWEKSTFEGLTQWREDMDMRDASMGKATIMMRTKDGDTSAARKMLDTAKPAKVATPVGRPSTKAEKAASAEEKRKEERQEKINKLQASVAGEPDEA